MPKKISNRQANDAVRNLVLILGDQLDEDSAAFDDFEKNHDVVWMVEVPSESEHVWSHKARIALFLSAMRHFRNSLKQKHHSIVYREIDDPKNQGSFAAELADAIKRLKPEKLIVVEPGEWRVEKELQQTAEQCGLPIEIRPDRHFLCSKDEFAKWAKGRKQLRMEFFYREMRKRYNTLMEGKDPIGGKWNYDAENRGSFGKKGPSDLPEPIAFSPNKVTKEVFKIVEDRFEGHPGSLDHFDWPVTVQDANEALDDFIEHRLPKFGQYQDAMWTNEPFLYHARISAALNLKLLNPRDVIAAAEKAYLDDKAPLSAVEGFIRQVLGWREYIRGIYWHKMPEYADGNALDAHIQLPEFYWTGDTEMNCLAHAIGQTLEHGYAHHIQRLMVTGLYALLLGVEPKQIHEWYLAVYVDAVEWVELPNVIGMSQFADGGFLGSKPYAATGKYIKRMSNYCDHCQYNPTKSTGKDACPFTTLYWDFLMRHEERLKANTRMQLQLRNLDRLDEKEKKEIREHAKALRKE
ncbi:MAG: cryptochrome/photolyase family protein [Gemmataceae bacterium]